MKIAIVNDVAAIRHLLNQIITEKSNHTVLWSAENGKVAVEKASEQAPDMILMDLFMPVMDGVEATEKIMKTSPCAILVVTASVSENADMVFRAMSHGALDAISTPNLNPLNKNSNIDEFFNKLSIVERLISSSDRLKGTRGIPTTITHTDDLPLVCIGSSTGGPGALVNILSNIPETIDAAFVVIQHVDRNFTQGLCDWLDAQTSLKVTIAAAGIKPQKGHVYIAGGDEHLSISETGQFLLDMEPIEYVYRPSINISFESASRHWPGRTIGVLLTGMGSDGAEGLLSLKNTGAHTIAQDKDSCAVFGMPRAAINLDAASSVLPVEKIANDILNNLDTDKNKVNLQANGS